MKTIKLPRLRPGRIQRTMSVSRLMFLARAHALSRLLILCCTLVFAGCASQPAKHFIRTGPSYGSSIGTVDRVGLLSDTLVLYDRSGTNNTFSLEDSILACTNMLLDARQHLQKKGYQVVFAHGPFVGACVATDKRYRISDKRHGDLEERPAPFYLASEVGADTAYREAILKAIKRGREAVADRGELPTETLRGEPSLQDSLKLIQQRTGVRYLLILCGDGKIVSGGKQAGQAIGTALLSTIMTAGLVTVTAHNISFLDSFVGLIDLETAEMLWTNSLRLTGNPGNEGLYKGTWSNVMLYHLPDRTKATKP